MTGKEKCTLLKRIRCRIAKKNGIDYATTECTFQGECKGTCPKCEAELRYLTNELEKIKQSGKRVAIAGIAAAMVATSASGCAQKDEKDPFSVVSPFDSGLNLEKKEEPGKLEEITEGILPAPEDASPQPEEFEELNGNIAAPDDFSLPPNTTPDSEVSEELTGDIAIDYDAFTFDYFLGKNQEEQRVNLELFLRHELQEHWAEYLTEKTETADVYVYGEKTLAITYREDGTMEDFILSWDEEETP